MDRAAAAVGSPFVGLARGDETFGVDVLVVYPVPQEGGLDVVDHLARTADVKAAILLGDGVLFQ